MIRIPSWVTAALVLAPAPVTAQSSVYAGAATEAYTISDPTAVPFQSVELSTLPFGAATRLGAFGFRADGTFAHAALRLPNGATASVDGLGDVFVAADAVLAGLRLSLSALLPTGDVSSTLDEVAVVGLLSSDLLPFSTTQWGGGGMIGGDVGYQTVRAGYRLGLSVGYAAARASDALGAEGITYAPGDQMRGRVVLESAVGDTGLFSLMIGAQRYFADRYDGRNLFEPGTRAEGVLAFALPLGPRESMRAWLGVYHLGAGSLLEDPTAPRLPGVALPGVSEPLSRDLFTAGAETRVARGRFEAVPRADVRVLRRAGGSGQGWLGSVGGHADYRLSGGRRAGRVVLTPSGTFRFGRIVAAEGVDSAVVGWGAGLTLRLVGL